MRPTLFVLLFLSLLAGLVAISGDSFWIDEGNAAYKACQPTFGEWIGAMKKERGSDAQMPLYMGWLWAWEKGFGHTEQALRLANLPWILLGHACLLIGLSRSRFRPRVAVAYAGLAAFAPFLCYYLNEVRPYAMQYGAGCMVLACLLEIDAAPERALAPRLLGTGVAGMLLLAGGSLLGIPWTGAAFLAACWIVWKGGAAQKLRLSLASILTLGVLCIGMALLGFYYLETLKAGAGASKAAKTSLVSCLFVAYEIAGLAGLGPNRANLRETGIGALIPYALPLAAGAITVFGAGLAGVVQCARKTGRRLPPAWMLIALVLPILFTVGLGVASHFRVLGRHFMPAFPLLLLLAAIALEALWNTRWRALAALFFVTWICSSAALRFSATQRKDDYRSASAVAQNAVAAGKRVWWAADEVTGKYYDLDFTPAGKLVRWMNATEVSLAGQPEPDLVILSKRDIYDNAGALDRYIACHGFTPGATFTAFTVYEKRR